MLASTRRAPPLLLIQDPSFIFTPIHTSLIYWEYVCLPKQPESFSNKYDFRKIHSHMPRLFIWFKWRGCCFQRLQSWSGPVTGHTAYRTYSKLFFFPPVLFCGYILLCLVWSFYFLLTCVPNVLLSSCVPPKPGFAQYLPHISLVSTAMFPESLTLHLTSSLVWTKCCFLTLCWFVCFCVCVSCAPVPVQRSFLSYSFVPLWFIFIFSITFAFFFASRFVASLLLLLFGFWTYVISSNATSLCVVCLMLLLHKPEEVVQIW